METVKECSLKPKIYTFILLKMFGVKSHKGYRISTIKIELAKYIVKHKPAKLL